MKKTYFIALATLVCTTIHAQIQSQDFYSFRMNNMFNVNPAYAASEADLKLYVGGQSQARGLDFNMKNMVFGIFSKFSENQGLGFNVISDSRGAFQTTKASLSYAYLLKINDNQTLSFGVSTGVLSNAFVQNRLANMDMLDLSDPTLNQNYYNSIQFIMGAGLHYKWKNLQVSASLPHLVSTDRGTNMYTHALASYRIKASEKFEFVPSIYFQSIPSLSQVFGGQLRTTFNDLLWAQVGYQSNNSFLTGIGFSLENFDLGYGFRVSNSSFASISNGTHELVLSYKIANKKKRSMYNPTLIEIDHRLAKLLTKKITAENKEEVIDEVQKIKKLTANTVINDTTPEAANEAAEFLRNIEQKLVLLQNKLNEK